MSVNLNLADALPVKGVQLATLAAGIKSDQSDDLVLIALADSSRVAAVFTQSAFSAAPVLLSREYLQINNGAVRALLINSGNANAGTGEPGLEMARGHTLEVAEALGIKANQVLPFSTGVIGQLLPDQIMKSGIVRCGQMLSDSSVDSSAKSAWYAAARGIMTTDTQPKITSRTAIVDGQTATISGMCKGAGMIQPNMATMLSYVFTDAAVDVQILNRLLAESVDVSFNSITVDSDTSTNDSCVFVSTGTGPAIDEDHPDWPMFVDALTDLFVTLAQAVIRDAEGATKFITVSVSGGVNTDECKQVGYAVANSPLVKTAFFASDANVGRLVMAIGKSGVENLDASRITVRLGDVAVFESGGIAPGYTEEQGTQAVAGEEIDVLIDLGRGSASAAIYTSDLSHDYVSINADYRS